MIFKSRIRKLNIVVAILAILCCLGACANEEQEVSQPVSVTSEHKNVMEFDSIDTHAVVTAKDDSKNAVTLLNQKVKRTYTLYYDGTSRIYDKYGSSIVIDQIEQGDVVDVAFIKDQKLIYSLSKSEDVWVYENITDFVIDSLTKRIKINGGDYHFSEAFKIYSEKKEAQIIDINDCDVLRISGRDHEVYSVVIDQGHGYLRLKGQELFEGGWIEVGSKIIRTVTKEMLLAVPVGEYEVRLSNGKHEGTRSIKIKKNQETEMDVSDMVEIEEKDSEGTLILAMEPAGAIVYIDGKEVDITKPLKLEFGVHQLIAKSEGYKSLTQYIKVDQENATLEVTLEKTKNLTEIDSESMAASPVPEATTFISEAVSTGSTEGYRVYVVAPEDTEVYVDGVYIGITPVNFAKTESVRVVTLRKDGYITRSYTITLDGTPKDETFSFSSLEKDVESATESTSEDSSEDAENP